jgi:hypothetical protein
MKLTYFHMLCVTFLLPWILRCHRARNISHVLSMDRVPEGTGSGPKALRKFTERVDLCLGCFTTARNTDVLYGIT